MTKFIERKFQEAGKPKKFQIKIEENAPVQGNGYDCGVLVSQNAEKIARNIFVNTRQENMPEARKRMISELYTGAIDPDHWPKPDTLHNIEKPSRRKEPIMDRNQKLTYDRKKGTG